MSFVPVNIALESIVHPAIVPEPVAITLGSVTTEVLAPNEPDNISCIPSALKFVEEDIADVCDLIVDACDSFVLACVADVLALCAELLADCAF